MIQVLKYNTGLETRHEVACVSLTELYENPQRERTLSSFFFIKASIEKPQTRNGPILNQSRTASWVSEERIADDQLENIV